MDIADFIARYHDQKEDVDFTDALTVEGRERSSDIAERFYQRVAERGRFDLDALVTAPALDKQVIDLTRVAVARLVAGQPLQREVGMVTKGGWIDGFMAGVLWRDQLDLPDLDQLTDEPER